MAMKESERLARHKRYESMKSTEEGRKRLAAYRERSNATNRERYKTDKKFRREILDTAARWRKDNHDFDMARKAVDGWGLTERQKAHKREIYQAWQSRMSAKQKSKRQKYHSKVAVAWDRKQRSDPELREYYLAQRRKSLSAEERAESKARYQAIMAQRKFDKRRERIEVLMSGCSERQRAKIMAKLDTFDKRQYTKSTTVKKKKGAVKA